MSITDLLVLKLLDYVESLGHAKNDVCDGVGKKCKDVLDGRDSFTDEEKEHLWFAAIEKTSMDDIGYHFGLQLSFESLGTFGLLMLHCSTLGEALEKAKQFTPLVSGILEMDFSMDDTNLNVSVSPKLEFKKKYPTWANQMCLGGLSLIISCYQSLSMKKPRLSRVALPRHIKNRNLFAYCFNGQVEVTESEFGFSCDKRIMDLPVINADSRLKPILMEIATKEINAQSNPWSSKIYNYLNVHFDPEQASLSSVASSFGLSPRTLQRRLKEENQSYNDILIEFKTDLAKTLLRNETNAKEVAARLGFQHVNAFYKSFKVWTGKTVVEFTKSKA